MLQALCTHFDWFFMLHFKSINVTHANTTHARDLIGFQAKEFHLVAHDYLSHSDEPTQLDECREDVCICICSVSVSSKKLRLVYNSY